MLDGHVILTDIDNYSSYKVVKPGEAFGDYFIQEQEDGTIDKTYNSTAQAKNTVELLVIEQQDFYHNFGLIIFQELQNLLKILLLNKYLFNINPYVLLILLSSATRNGYKLGMIVQKQGTVIRYYS